LLGLRLTAAIDGRAKIGPTTPPLAEAIRFEAFTVWEKPGIRARLLDTATSRLAMGFVTEHDGHSLHVLNVVSPAFTCALPFAEHVYDKCVAYTPSPTVR